MQMRSTHESTSTASQGGKWRPLAGGTGARRAPRRVLESQRDVYASLTGLRQRHEAALLTDARDSQRPRLSRLARAFSVVL